MTTEGAADPAVPGQAAVLDQTAVLDQVPGLDDPAEPWGGQAASWIRRVVAVLFDSLVLSAVAFLTADVVPVSVPSYVPVPFGAGEPAAASWTRSGWMVALTVVMLAMQAYLGSTPGKLAMGIAVVRDADARPVGLVRTVLRLVAHLLDAVLLIGYLRPIWHRERRTFADSLTGTVVLRTPSPLRYRFPRGPGIGPSAVLEAAVVPRWRRVATGVSMLVCAASSAMAFGPVQSASTSAQVCSPVVVPAAGVPFDAATSFGSGAVEVSLARTVETRLGIERPRASGEASLLVRWDTGGRAIPDGATARFVVLDGAGDAIWAVHGVVRRGVLVPARADQGAVAALTDGVVGFEASGDLASRYGPSVAERRWQMTLVQQVEAADGSPVAATSVCSAPEVD
ncbi:MAG TPA: RDD family protein [Cellulomonas sp.]